MGAECSCRPAAGLQQCLLASAGRYFWDYLSPAQICTRRQHCRLSHRLLVPSQGQLLRLFFFLQSSPLPKLRTFLAPPTVSGTAKHCPLLSFIMQEQCCHQKGPTARKMCPPASGSPCPCHRSISSPPLPSCCTSKAEPHCFPQLPAACLPSCSGCGGQLPLLAQPTVHRQQERIHARKIQSRATSALQPLSSLWRGEDRASPGFGNDNNIQIIFHFVECILSVQPSSGLFM